jgi:hypothetical protein
LGCDFDLQEKINYFWIVEKKVLEDKKAELRNKERELQVSICTQWAVLHRMVSLHFRSLQTPHWLYHVSVSGPVLMTRSFAVSLQDLEEKHDVEVKVRLESSALQAWLFRVTVPTLVGASSMESSENWFRESQDLRMGRALTMAWGAVADLQAAGQAPAVRPPE